MSWVPDPAEVMGSANGERDKCDVSVDMNCFSSVLGTKRNVEKFEYDGKKRDLRTLAEFVCSSEIEPKGAVAADFIKWAGVFNPMFNPSFDEVESECMQVYEERKVEIKKYLQNYDGQISLSVDILRCENPFDCIFGVYLCLSAHFVDENWKRRKWVLCCYPLWVPGPSDEFCHKYEDWGIFRWLEVCGIENKISTLTMNGDHCYTGLIEYVKRHILEKNQLQLDGQLFRVYCCADMIKLMVQDAFGKIEDVVQKVRHAFITHYPMWFLTTFNLQHVLELRSLGKFSARDAIDSHDVPSPEEWKKVEGVCEIVENISEGAKALFQTKVTEHQTSNVYLYHLHELREVLTQSSLNSTGFNKTVVEDMLEKFNKYWDDMFLVLAISAALDPRFKMKYVEFVCSKVKRMNENSQAAAVLGAIHKMFDEYMICFPGKKNFVSGPSSDSDSEGESSPSDQVKRTFSILEDYHQFIQSNNQPTKKSDLDRYLEEPVLPWSQDFSALTWWRTTGAEYPTLSRMARDFLAIPISLSTTSGAFYTTPRPADDTLACLKPELMNALMCTRSWRILRH